MNITVQLLHKTPLEILIGAIRQCYDSSDLSDSIRYEYNEFELGNKDKKLIESIIKNGHTSTLEHIVFNFQIKGISRLVLQELARHRMASLSVKSTRYTLKELKNEEPFYDDKGWDYKRANKYINFTDIPKINEASLYALNDLHSLIQMDIIPDQAKYALPECYKTDLYWTINARSLINFFQLRRSERAHFEIRELADKIYEQVPEDYKFIFNVL